MANSYGQFTLWVSVSNILKSKPSCTSHNLRASFQRCQVHRGLQHEMCPHAATQSYMTALWLTNFYGCYICYIEIKQSGPVSLIIYYYIYFQTFQNCFTMHHYRTRYQDKSITRLPNEVLLTHILHDRDLSADDIMDFGRTSHRFKELSKPVWRQKKSAAIQESWSNPHYMPSPDEEQLFEILIDKCIKVENCKFLRVSHL